MGAANQRIASLLDRWLASVEQHGRYLALDDAAYAKAQPWPPHERPTRFVIDLAKTRLLELKRLLAEREARGDEGFAEALELMGLLTNLLGSEHVERFIPLAQSAPPPPTGPRVKPKPVEPVAPAPAKRKAVPARPTRAAATAPRRTAAPPRRPIAVPDKPLAASDKAVATVIADAARLMSWGREWPQLAGLIARLADRPPEAEVWRILRHHRSTIEQQARRPRD